MSELVDRLCTGDHPVEVSMRPEKTIKAFQECLDRSYVHIMFTKTKGGTELGIQLEPELCDFSEGDVETRTGSFRLIGRLTLDYVKVRCIADIDLLTLDGKGHLERVVEHDVM